MEVKTYYIKMIYMYLDRIISGEIRCDWAGHFSTAGTIGCTWWMISSPIRHKTLRRRLCTPLIVSECVLFHDSVTRAI